MGLYIKTNITAQRALGDLNETQRSLANTFEKLSSGLRINSARDDAAGLAVSEKLRTKTQSLRQTRRNANDGISSIQTAEGATNQVADILKRMRELATQSSSETLHNEERSYIQSEFQQLSDEIDRISDTTEFNGVKLTDGESSGADTSLDVQVGINNSSNDRIAIQFGNLKTSKLGVAHSGGVGQISMASATSARDALSKVTKALKVVNTYRSRYGAVQNRIQSSLNNIETSMETTAAADSRIRDADFAGEAARMAKYQVMQQAGTAILGQANGLSQGALRLL